MKYINANKLNSIKLDKDNFYVLIDFDRTITKGNSISAWRVLYHSELLGTNFREQYDKIHEETSTNENETDEIKRQAFENRFKRFMKLLENFNFSDEMVRKAVKKTDLRLRDGAKEFLKQMYEKNVPVVIISSSIGNVIKEYLKFNNCNYNNIYIYANFFDTNVKEKKHICNVTPYNKSQISFSENLKKLIKNKKYILLCRRYCRRYQYGKKRKFEQYYSSRIPRQKNRAELK